MNDLHDDVAIAGMLGELHLLRVQHAQLDLHARGMNGSEERDGVYARLAATSATLQLCEEIMADAISLGRTETPESEQQVLDLLRYRYRAVRLLRESGRCDISMGDGVFAALEDLIVALESIIVERDGSGRRIRLG